MSTFDARKSVLERLQHRERNREWAAEEKTTRRWSAESGRDVLVSSGRRPHERKATSPQYLPRLKTPPEWPREYHHESDLRRGKMTVVPPLRTKEGFVSKSTKQSTRPQQRVQNRRTNQNQWPGAPDLVSQIPVAQYGQPYGPGIVPSNPAQQYPPGMYPVPMYMTYAPVFLPHLQNNAGFPTGVVDGRQMYQRRMTRDEAATIIQKYFRGWRERKISDEVFPIFSDQTFIMISAVLSISYPQNCKVLWVWDSRYFQLKFLSQTYFARDFIEDLISEFLQEEIIPDLLISVLSHEKLLSHHDPLFRISSSVCSDVIAEDVSLFVNQIAASVFYSQIQLENLSGDDPLIQVCRELTDEVVNEMAIELVPSTVKSLVKSHMTVIKSDDWLEELILETIQPMMMNVATLAIEGYEYESAAEEIIDEVTDDLIKPVIVEAWKEVIDSHRNVQVLEIGKYAGDRVLDTLFLEHLLSHLAGNNLSLYFRDYIEQTMDGLVCGILLHQFMLVDDSCQDTLSNYVLQEYHQELYSSLALDVILEEMCANLDEDMQDLLEKEKAYNDDHIV